LLEYEISMLQHLQGGKHQKSSPKPTAKPGVQEKGGEEDEEEEGAVGRSKNYRSDSRTTRESVGHLPDGFVRSFLSGELCLRGVSTRKPSKSLSAFKTVTLDCSLVPRPLLRGRGEGKKRGLGTRLFGM
jgi:hypothetical protein